ncbi:MAG: hypothetical protein NTX47_04715 [Candidatus Omnitrophica bacterium]|nr:hypothetical protein [Candidatus Omnitrophota bacterium]
MWYTNYRLYKRFIEKDKSHGYPKNITRALPLNRPLSHGEDKILRDVPGFFNEHVIYGASETSEHK